LTTTSSLNIVVEAIVGGTRDHPGRIAREPTSADAVAESSAGAEPLAAPADETEDTPEFLDCGRDI
jgi:hypothetical protein